MYFLFAGNTFEEIGGIAQFRKAGDDANALYTFFNDHLAQSCQWAHIAQILYTNSAQTEYVLDEVDRWSMSTGWVSSALHTPPA